MSPSELEQIAYRNNLKAQSSIVPGIYVSPKTGKRIEILNLDVRAILENGKPRNGLVLYRYVASDTLRIAPKLWFLEVLDNGKPRFVKEENYHDKHQEYIGG